MARRPPGHRPKRPRPQAPRPARKRRPRAAATPDRTALQPRLDRIDALSRAARAGWFSLLFLVSFIGVTLLGVEDADFFIRERQTPLPLLGVSIPTLFFFSLAPLLCAALYANLHFHLLKLWEVTARHAVPPQIGTAPLSDALGASFIVDLALANRPDCALRPRPMQWITRKLTALLVFWATPLVLAGFWWRSMPAHLEWLTCIFVGGSLLFTLLVGGKSWLRMRRLALGRRTVHRRWEPAVIRSFAAFCVAVTLLGWFTTEGTLDHYGRSLLYVEDSPPRTNSDQAEATKGIPAYIAARWSDFTNWQRRARSITEEAFDAAWWTGTPMPALLSSADLSGVDFVGIPPGWRDFQAARNAFHIQWCADNGIPAELCGPASRFEDRSDTLIAQRQAWCNARFLQWQDAEVPDQACTSHFSDLTQRFASEWSAERAAARAELGNRDLSRADLRRADLSGARMEGADLWQARMEGADLSQARMEGADLSGARMEGANLRGARMEGADLRLARMEGANLSGARMEGANLRGARMEGANLRGARMEGANLLGARMEGADLRYARMEGADLRLARFDSESDFADAVVQYASVKLVDLSSVNLSHDQVKSTFGDGSVTLPDGLAAGQPPLDHWPIENLDWDEFYDRWRAWQLEQGYEPP